MDSISLFEQIVEKAQLNGLRVELLQEKNYFVEKANLDEFLTLVFNEITQEKYSFTIVQDQYAMIQIDLFEQDFVEPLSFSLFTILPENIKQENIEQFNKSIKSLKQQRIIPIIGPDGVGKTTLLTAVMDSVEEKITLSRFKKIVRRSVIYNILYPINRYFLKKKLGYKPEKDQHDDVHYFLSLTAGALYYPYLVYKTLLKKKIVFVDRFFNDYLFENISFRDKETKVRDNWKTLMNFIPKVHWMFHLDASAEVILSRKDELTKEDILTYKEVNFQAYLEKPSLVYTYINTEAQLEHCKNVIVYTGKKANIFQSGANNE